MTSKKLRFGTDPAHRAATLTSTQKQDAQRQIAAIRKLLSPTPVGEAA